MENEIFEASYYWIHIRKIIRICPNNHTDCLRFLFTEDYMKIKKGLELVSRPHFHVIFWWKIFFCNIMYTVQISLPDCVCLSHYSVKCVLCFMLKHLMMSLHFNTWKVKIWLSQKQKELSKWNRKAFFLVSQVLSFRHKKQTSKK